MATSVLRPNSTVSNTGTVTGAATAHAATSDDSDLSRVLLNDPGGVPEAFSVEMGDLALPAGAVIKTVTVRLRIARVSGLTATVFRVLSDIPNVGGSVTYQSGAIVTVAVSTFSRAFSDAELDGATLTVTRDPSVGGSTTGAVYEVYLDVVYVPPPIVNVTAPTGLVTNTNLPTITWVSDTLGGGL